jgi:hypothetical protein
MSISEVVDEIWAKEYKDIHPDLDRFVDDPTDSTDQFWSKMEADSNYVFSRCQIHPSAYLHLFQIWEQKGVEQTWRVRMGFIGRWAECKTYVCSLLYIGILLITRKTGSKPTDSSLHCRFLFPKKVQPFGVDENTGAFSLPRNHPWVNKGNKILSCALRSNHDVSFIANSSRMCRTTLQKMTSNSTNSS